MDQERFAAFSVAYQAGLRAAVEAKPADYALREGETATEYATRVSAIMLHRIGSGGHWQVNYGNSEGFKRACRTLGIPYTRKSIFAYLGLA